jgi:hypothetical protein
MDSRASHIGSAELSNRTSNHCRTRTFWGVPNLPNRRRTFAGPLPNLLGAAKQAGVEQAERVPI